METFCHEMITRHYGYPETSRNRLKIVERKIRFQFLCLEVSRWLTQAQTQKVNANETKYNPNEECNQLSVEQTIKQTVTSANHQRHQKPSSTSTSAEHHLNPSSTPPPNSTKIIIKLRKMKLAECINMYEE